MYNIHTFAFATNCRFRNNTNAYYVRYLIYIPLHPPRTADSASNTYICMCIRSSTCLAKRRLCIRFQPPLLQPPLLILVQSALQIYGYLVRIFSQNSILFVDCEKTPFYPSRTAAYYTHTRIHIHTHTLSLSPSLLLSLSLSRVCVCEREGFSYTYSHT